MSQEDFAHEVGVHRTYVSLVERGQGNPSLSGIQSVAQALGQKVSIRAEVRSGADLDRPGRPRCPCLQMCNCVGADMLMSCQPGPKVGGRVRAS